MPKTRERLYGMTMKIMQSMDAKQEHIENMEELLQNLEKDLERIKQRNDESLATTRQILELTKLVVGDM